MFNWLKRRDNRANHEFTDEDRQLSAERRRLKLERDTLENEKAKLLMELEKTKVELQIEELQARIDDIRGEPEPEPQQQQSGLNPEMMMMSILLPSLMKGQSLPPVQNTNQVQQSTSQRPDMSDDEIRGLLSSVPKQYIDKIPNTPNFMIKQIAKDKANIDLNDNEINRAKVLSKEYI